MRIDLERHLKDLRGAVPYPSAAATQRALAEVLEVVKRREDPGRRRRRILVGLAVVLLASGASFVAGRSSDGKEAESAIPSAASFLPLTGDSAITLRPVAVRCRVVAALVKWDAAGHVQVLEYTWGPKGHRYDHPVPTGRVLSYADSAARTFNPACVPVKPVLPRARAYDTATYDPRTKLQFFCNSSVNFDQAPGFVIQIRPVVKRGRLLGNRLLVQEGLHPKVAPMIDATVAGPGSRFVVRVQRCFKPFWQ